MRKDIATLSEITAPILDDIKIFQDEFENYLARSQWATPLGIQGVHDE